MTSGTPPQTQKQPRSEAERPSAASTAVVAAVFTSPETVLEDIHRAMKLAGVEEHLDKNTPTLLKINISWQHWYPACSTTPWQLDGVIQGLQREGYKELIPAQNGTVVVNSYEGEAKNRHLPVLQKYGLKSLHLDTPPMPWVPFQPKGKMLVLDDIFPEGLLIPESFPGKNILHLPTLKTHVFTTMTGAMKTAFGGLLNRKRPWTHSVIHETLVDLLTIQKEIHPGLFAVMDGTFAGDGPGPRAMRWHIKNVILASADQVAIDAIAAKLMGFDPLGIKYIRLAHEHGLGCGDPEQIQVVGDDVSNVDWRFSGVENTLASRGQKLIYWGPLKRLEHLLLRSPIAPWAFFASNLYHNGYWLNLIGKRRIKRAMETEWGRLFQEYGDT